MRPTLLSLLLLSGSLALEATASPLHPQSPSPSLQQQTTGAKLQLAGMQQRVQQAFASDMRSGKAEALPALLQLFAAERPTGNRSLEQLHTYWQAYLRFFQTLYYSQHQQQERAAEAVGEGIKLLEDYGHKGSEEYALLARLEGLATSYAGAKTPQLAMSMAEHAAQAIALDPQNPRAYIVAGVNNYFTPVAFGGKTKVKEYLTKALELPVQQTPSDYLPSWGRDEAYEYLIRLLLDTGARDEAAALCTKALGEFPASPMLQRLKVQLGATPASTKP
nr:hypothetical protein [uncultured Porphyromonas sp.]